MLHAARQAVNETAEELALMRGPVLGARERADGSCARVLL